MSRLELPALLATPLRPALGSAAETRSANICAKRSTKASNGCEECLAIWPHYSKKGWRCKLRTLPRSPIILFDGHPPGVSFRFPPLVVSPDLRLQHLLLFLLVPLRRAQLRGRIDGLGQIAVTKSPGVERRVRKVVGAVRVLFAFGGTLI